MLARKRTKHDHSSSPAVADRVKRPTREHRTGSPQTLSYSVLLRMGFAWLPMSPPGPVSSYLTVSPLPPNANAGGGLLSVALSSSSPRLGVTQHPALWSPDFPPAAPSAAGDHLPCSGHKIAFPGERSLPNNILANLAFYAKRSPLTSAGRGDEMLCRRAVSSTQCFFSSHNIFVQS